MIEVHPFRRCKTWKQAKREWGSLMREKGLQEINRPAPIGYGEAPHLVTGKVEGEGFVIYPHGYDPREINHTLSSRASIYGNRYCGTLNSF
mgnify:CR=1 FL=1